MWIRRHKIISAYCQVCPESMSAFHPYSRAEVTADCPVYATNDATRVWLAMEDGCWRVSALRNVNSLAASYRAEEGLKLNGPKVP